MFPMLQLKIVLTCSKPTQGSFLFNFFAKFCGLKPRSPFWLLHQTISIPSSYSWATIFHSSYYFPCRKTRCSALYQPLIKFKTVPGITASKKKKSGDSDTDHLFSENHFAFHWQYWYFHWQRVKTIYWGMLQIFFMPLPYLEGKNCLMSTF